jgi:thymidylate synthase
MYTAINGNNFNELALNVYKDVLTNGRVQPSRNGDIHCINNAVLNLKNPASRHLYLEGRNSNPISQIAETFWVMAGDDRIDPYLSFFLPRAKDYSDDGVTWRGAYGPRLYMYDQLQEAVNVFVNDGWETRHSVIQILLPELDSKVGMEIIAYDCKNTGQVNKGNDECTTKDRPCNNEIVMFMTPNEDGTYSLNLNIFQRSGDAIWGALNINVFEWTFLQELVANTLNQRMDETVVLGEYTHFVTNLHIYDSTASQAKNAIDYQHGGLMSEWDTQLGKLNLHDIAVVLNHGKLIATNDVDTDREFFALLVELYTTMINDEKVTDYMGGYYTSLNNIFISCGVPSNNTNNLLWEYAIAVFAYILQKNGFDFDDVETINNPKHKDFDQCLDASKFVKFPVFGE